MPANELNCPDCGAIAARTKADLQKTDPAMTGVQCELDVVAGGPHAFEGMAPDAQVSKDYLNRAKGWLRASLSGAQ